MNQSAKEILDCPRLPVDYPVKEAFSIYAGQLKTFLTVVLVISILLGTVLVGMTAVKGKLRDLERIQTQAVEQIEGLKTGISRVLALAIGISLIATISTILLSGASAGHIQQQTQPVQPQDLGPTTEDAVKPSHRSTVSQAEKSLSEAEVRTKLMLYEEAQRQKQEEKVEVR